MSSKYIVSWFAIGLVTIVGISHANAQVFFLNIVPSNNILGASSYYTFEFNKNSNAPTGSLKTIKIDFPFPSSGGSFILDKAKLIDVSGIGSGILKQTNPQTLEYTITDPLSGPISPIARIIIGGIVNPRDVMDNTITLTGLNGAGIIVNEPRSATVTLVPITSLIQKNSINAAHIAPDTITSRELAPDIITTRELADLSKLIIFHCNGELISAIGAATVVKFPSSPFDIHPLGQPVLSLGTVQCDAPGVEKGDMVFTEILTDKVLEIESVALQGKILVKILNPSLTFLPKGTAITFDAIVLRK